MGKLQDNQDGVSHIVLIIAFVLVLAGLVGFAYMRISDKNSSKSDETTQTANEEGSAADEEPDVIDDSQDPTAELNTE